MIYNRSQICDVCLYSMIFVAGVDPLTINVAGHNLTLIDKCLELGCGINTKDQAGNTPMNLAEGRKYFDVIRWFQVQLTPGPNTAAILGDCQKPAVLENGRKGSHILNIIYNQEKHIRDLKISGGIGGRRSTEGRYGGGTTDLKYWGA